jgi:hypothetical protein
VVRKSEWAILANGPTHQKLAVLIWVVLFGGQKPYSLRHQQLHHQKFQDPTLSLVFAAFKVAQNNLEKLNY